MLSLGSILVGAGVIAVDLLALLFRHPRAPGWTRPELVAMLAVIPVVGVLGLGCGYILVGAYRLLHGTGEVYELAAPFSAALAVAAFWYVLRVPQRLRSTAARPRPRTRAASPPPSRPCRSRRRRIAPLPRPPEAETRRRGRSMPCAR